LHQIDDQRLLALTTAIVTGFVRAQALAPDGLADLIIAVHGALLEAARPSPSFDPPPRRQISQVRAHVRPRGCVNFQDRRVHQLLQRRVP